MKNKIPGHLIAKEIARNGNTYSITKVMEKYAKQRSLEFYKWMEAERYTESNSLPGKYFYSWAFKSSILTELYNKFLKSQK